MPKLALLYEILCALMISRSCFVCLASSAASQGLEVHLISAGYNSGGLKVKPAPDDRLELRAASVFEGVGKLQNSLLPEGGAINLQADRQSFGRLTAGH